MPPVPTVNNVGAGLQCAMSEDGIVNSAAHNAESSGGLQRIGVFIAIERYYGQLLSYVPDEEHGLVTTDSVLARHPGQRGVDLGQTVRSTAAVRFVELYEQREAGFVMDVISIEDRNQH